MRILAALALAAVLAGCGISIPDFPSGVPDVGDPGPVGGTTGSPEQQHNLDKLNDYRRSVGAPDLVMDPQLNAFALAGTQQEMNDHTAHAHFNAASAAGTLFTTDGFHTQAAENQGDPYGWFPLGSVNDQIDQILQMMWDEGPGGGHYENMRNPAFRRVGIGLALDGAGRLYFTNDFSD